MVNITQSVSVVYSSLEYGDIKARFADDKIHLTLGEGHTAPNGPLHFTTLADDPDKDHWLWCFPFVKSEGKRSPVSLNKTRQVSRPSRHRRALLGATNQGERIMAQYLIIHEDGAIDFAEAKNMTGAATAGLLNEETATIYRLAGPGKTVTARVEQTRHIEVSDAGEDQ